MERRKEIMILTAALSIVALIAVAGGWWFTQRTDIAAGNTQAPAPAATRIAPDGLALTLSEGGAIGQVYSGSNQTPVVENATIELDIDANSFDQIRVFDHNPLTDSGWVEPSENYSFEPTSVGYQIIVLEGRRSNGDTTEVAQTSIPLFVASDQINENIQSVARFGTNGITVTITDGTIVWNPTGSTVENRINLTEADLTQWSLTADGQELQPTNVDVWSRGNGSGEAGDPVTGTRFDVTLTFDQPLSNGDFTLSPTTDRLNAFEFTLSNTTTTPLIQTSQIGFAPSDTKIAYLGGWYNSTTPFISGTTIDVIDTNSGEAALTVTAPRSASNSADVIPIDFSDLTETGRYQVCAQGAGCSAAFAISPDVYAEAASKVAQAFYHQRSGIAFGDATPINRPRPRHPEDGTQVRSTDLTLLAGETTLRESLFSEIVAQSGDPVDARGLWGGHHDAGDWDRRIQHLWAARLSADLVRSFPEIYNNDSLSIPESGNGIPDLLDEGLWSLDFYRRTQTDDGGVSGGIEASEHPQPGATSWTSDLQLFIFNPDPWSSYIYASVAAEYSVLLQDLDPERAADFDQSARLAFDWAEANSGGPQEQTERIAEQRVVAAASLAHLTDEQRYFDIFEAESTLANAPVGQLNCHAHAICDAAWIYARINSDKQNQNVLSNIEQSFNQTAQATIAGANERAYFWTQENDEAPDIWGLGLGGNPNTVGLLRAYELTENPEFLNAATRAASSAVGANPLGVSYITGVGSNPAQYPLIVDSVNGAQPVWPGTPVFGNHTIGEDSDWLFQFRLSPLGVSDDPQTLPYEYQWQDVHLPQFTEFTVHQSHGPTLYTFGSLHALNS